ncbi:MAG: hypothetical protein ACLVAH_11320, partial [Anaeromassilibacillus sp.]
MNQAKKARRMAAALVVAVLLSTSMGTLSCADAAVSDGELDALQQEQLELQQQREKLEHDQAENKAKLDQLRADKTQQETYK